MPLEEVAQTFAESGYSRLPVYHDTIDNIIGVVHEKDFYMARLKKETKLEDLVKPTLYTTGSTQISQLLRTLREQHHHMAVVVDEYGGTSGLVTMEDILEEIVGNILDEHDEEDTYIEKKPDGTFVMNGMTPLEEVGEALNLDFEDEDYDTLNGLLISLIDKIPSEHEVFEVKYKGYIFEVLSVEDKMIKYVHVVPERSESAESDTATCQQDEKMVE